MKVMLELQDQPSNIKKVTVRHDIVIGRGADCNLRLSAPQVSRRHCFLRIGAEGASISDLDSSNGTTLNGKKLSSGKRYAIPDGALIAVGPIQFIAHVESEVPVGEVLEVGVLGGQLEADPATDINSSQLAGDFDSTLAGTPSEPGDGDAMNFAVERGGLSAREDEPTADCLVADPAGLGDVGEEELVVEVLEEVTEEEPVAEVIEVSDEIVALSDEAIEVLEVADVEELVEGEEILEVAEIIEDVDEIIEEVEVVEDEFIEVADDELIDVVEEIDDEVVEIIDEEEVLLLDDENIIEVVEEADEASEEVLTLDTPADSVVRGDCVENELKDFLQGLD